MQCKSSLKQALDCPFTGSNFHNQKWLMSNNRLLTIGVSVSHSKSISFNNVFYLTSLAKPVTIL
jgi:hypothetical protein